MEKLSYYERNKEKVKQRSREYYYKNIKPSVKRRQIFRDRTRSAQQKRRAKFLPIKLHLQKILGGVCRICGNADHRVLDFDHVDPLTKMLMISQNYHLPIEQLEDEIRKCQLLCANCHRIKTWESGGFDSRTRIYRNKFRESSFSPTPKHS